MNFVTLSKDMGRVKMERGKQVFGVFVSIRTQNKGWDGIVAGGAFRS